MAPKLTDPNSFLQNLVSRKGKSDLFGTYLTGVNILANAEEDYGYGIPFDEIEREIENTFINDRNDWNNLLVQTRMERHEFLFPISFVRSGEPYTVYFVVEGNKISSMVFIPSLTACEFKKEVVFFQALLKEVSLFAGKTPTTLRFTLGAVSISWDDLVDTGHARAVDITL
jgi:hypothetical protein